MPQATPELRNRWRSDDIAMAYLQDRGYKLTRRWEWVIPEGSIPTEDDMSAVDYLFQEWDFGGFSKISVGPSDKPAG